MNDTTMDLSLPISRRQCEVTAQMLRLIDADAVMPFVDIADDYLYRLHAVIGIPEEQMPPASHLQVFFGLITGRFYCKPTSPAYETPVMSAIIDYLNHQFPAPPETLPPVFF